MLIVGCTTQSHEEYTNRMCNKSRARQTKTATTTTHRLYCMHSTHRTLLEVNKYTANCLLIRKPYNKQSLTPMQTRPFFLPFVLWFLLTRCFCLCVCVPNNKYLFSISCMFVKYMHALFIERKENPDIIWISTPWLCQCLQERLVFNKQLSCRCAVLSLLSFSSLYEIFADSIDFLQVCLTGHFLVWTFHRLDV